METGQSTAVCVCICYNGCACIIDFVFGSYLPGSAPWGYSFAELVHTRHPGPRMHTFASCCRDWRKCTRAVRFQDRSLEEEKQLASNFNFLIRKKFYRLFLAKGGVLSGPVDSGAVEVQEVWGHCGFVLNSSRWRAADRSRIFRDVLIGGDREGKLSLLACRLFNCPTCSFMGLHNKIIRCLHFKEFESLFLIGTLHLKSQCCFFWLSGNL